LICYLKVEPGHLDKFHAAYGTLLKASMTPTLRKRDKKKEKMRADKVALRKKKLAELIVVKGGKRGAGRRQRQRKEKAALKRETIKEKQAVRLSQAAKPATSS
jgi:signal recognition particle subunit SRP14